MEIRKRKPIGKKNIKYIEELYATYSRRMFFIARKYVQNSDFAEDVVQSAFEKVLAYPDGILKVPRDNYLQMIDLDSLKQNLSRMDRRHRDTLLFRYVYGLKCKEIADIFKISERMVKIRCSEARVQLKKMMEEDEL